MLLFKNIVHAKFLWLKPGLSPVLDTPSILPLLRQQITYKSENSYSLGPVDMYEEADKANDLGMLTLLATSKLHTRIKCYFKNKFLYLCSYIEFTTDIIGVALT